MTSFLCTKEFEKFFSQVRLKEDIGSSLDSSIDLVLGDPRVIAFLDRSPAAMESCHPSSAKWLPPSVELPFATVGILLVYKQLEKKKR